MSMGTKGTKRYKTIQHYINLDGSVFEKFKRLYIIKYINMKGDPAVIVFGSRGWKPLHHLSFYSEEDREQYIKEVRDLELRVCRITGYRGD